MSIRILQGDVRERLAELPSDSFDCIVTSPPYWGLRDYGTAKWEGGDPVCDHLGPPMRTNNKPSNGTGSFHGGTSRANEPMGRVCSKCGAHRTDNQIGLEPTLTEYLDTMVAVCRELRRVLKPSGVFFLNLGDSYAGSWGNQGRKEERGTQRDINGPMMQAVQDGRYPSLASNTGLLTKYGGLKPKDLCMVPNRLAIRLQEPWYDGKIANVEDRIWLAAMIDAEGCMFIHKRKAGTGNHSSYTKADGTVSNYSRTQDTFGSGLEVANTSLAIVERCIAITGIGSICSQSPEQNDRRKQTIYRWNVRSNECRWIIEEVYPHLVAKQQQARILVGCPSSGPRADAAHAALIDLHNGRPTDIDFSPPASRHSPGWFVRSEIIWAKKNCMPESVTDRPTSSHEKIWLLTKSAKYWYDADAVREIDGGKPSGNGFVRDERLTYAGRGDPEQWLPGSGRNSRNVWTIASQPYSEAHFATFPPELAERCIKAGSSEKGCCPNCGSPWNRVTEKAVDLVSGSGRSGRKPTGKGAGGVQTQSGSYDIRMGPSVTTKTTGWEPSCDCPAHNPVPCHVLDPFGGAGTTGMVADRLSRDATMIELNPAYVSLIKNRIAEDAGMFAQVVAE